MEEITVNAFQVEVALETLMNPMPSTFTGCIDLKQQINAMKLVLGDFKPTKFIKLFETAELTVQLHTAGLVSQVCSPVGRSDG